MNQKRIELTKTLRYHHRLQRNPMAVTDKHSLQETWFRLGVTNFLQFTVKTQNVDKENLIQDELDFQRSQRC